MDARQSIGPHQEGGKNGPGGALVISCWSRRLLEGGWLQIVLGQKARFRPRRLHSANEQPSSRV